MCIRRILFAAVFLLAGSRAAESADVPPTSAAQTVARIHWLGMKHLSGDTNAARLMAIWNLPESRRLERQTLDKLSLAPWPWLHRNVDTNAAALLRPLLDDLVENESCLEIRQTTNQPGELVLAIRLDDQRAALWRTNLARVLESLTGIHPVPAPEPGYGWSLKKHHEPNFLELTRVDGWTIIGAAQDHNGLLDDLLTRIRQRQPPLPVGPTNDWLAADLDPLSLADIFSLSAAGGKVPSPAGAGDLSRFGNGERNSTEGEGPLGPSEEARTSQRARRAVEGSGDENKSEGRGEVGSLNIPTLNLSQLASDFSTFNSQHSTLNHLHLTVTGESSNVVTRGTLEFSRPLDLTLPPWNIPTNLIDEQLASFTLIRGFKPWLESSPAWHDLKIGPPPDQICIWAVLGFPMQSYFVAPLPDASNEVDRLAGWVLQKEPAWFGTNELAVFARSKQSNGLEWKGPPYMTPFLQSITVSNQDFVYGGGLVSPTASPMSPNALQATLNRPDLVYHDSEATGLRIDQWLYMGQFVRFVLHQAQLPPHSAGMLWLKAISPRLGDSVTDITQTGPNQLSFTRQSSIGFTGFELNLLVDWLESPQFPSGLYSLLTPSPTQP